MAYEITAPVRSVPGSRRSLGSPEDDPFVRYDAAMVKIQRALYWTVGLGFVSMVGVGALFLTRLGR